MRNAENLKLPSDLTKDELRELSSEVVISKYLDMQNAYSSLLNSYTFYRRQLSMMQQQTVSSSQIVDLARRINTGDITTMSEKIIAGVTSMFESGTGLLYLVDNDSGLLALKCSNVEDLKVPALDMNVDSDVLIVDFAKSFTDPLVINSPEHYESIVGREVRLTDVDDHIKDGALLCPLIMGANTENAKLVGALVLGGKEGGFLPGDADTATILAEMLAVTICQCQLLEAVSKLAETDGLTGMYNHRHFQQALNRQLAAVRRYGHSVSLVMVDIDHFKKFNDTHGHQAGDLVLKEVAACINHTVRNEIDIAARYGGEEFIIILPHTTINGASIVASRMRAAIENHPVMLAGDQLCVTASMGVAEYKEWQRNSEFIEAADSALYRAKENGRNRVELAE